MHSRECSILANRPEIADVVSEGLKQPAARIAIAGWSRCHRLRWKGGKGVIP